MISDCEKLHNSIRGLKRYSFPFEVDSIPANGVYLLFEKNELGHNGDRIVRIGTHTGNNNLIKRLNEHFLKENKNRSIFRKNIGRALLNKVNDDYLHTWNIDMTTKKMKDKYNSVIDKDFEENLEGQISSYIRENFTFSIIEVKDKEERLSLEKRLIKLVSSCNDCAPSDNWLGNYSPIDKIKLSGLWQTQHVECNE